MRVFLSWSGKKSKAAAEKFHQWLPDVIQAITPFMSKADILAGARWSSEIASELDSSHFGIVFLTKWNQERPWIMFEAGALSKTLGEAHVVPYLLDLTESDIPTGPLGQFQAKEATELGTWELLVSVNAALKEQALDSARLRRVFEARWQDLHTALKALPPDDDADSKPRRTDAVLADILAEVRGISRRLPGDTGAVMTDAAADEEASAAWRAVGLRAARSVGRNRETEEAFNAAANLLSIASSDPELLNAGYEEFGSAQTPASIELRGKVNGNVSAKARVAMYEWYKPESLGSVYAQLVRGLLAAAPTRAERSAPGARQEL